jgi:sugar lactone lactonase YvrE
MSRSKIELNANLEIAADVAADLGEGPIWDDETATLLFVDSTIGRIYRLNPESGTLRSVEVGQQIGAALPRRRGGLVVSAGDGLISVEDTGDVSLLVPIEDDRKDHRLNDAKCDSRGRLWSGTFSLSFVRGAGALYRVDQDLTLTRVAEGISISNGIAWSPDETTMYHVDTPTRGIDMLDYDIETGAATNRRRFVDIDRACGLPDGITVDAEGHVWVALYLGGAVRRYSLSPTSRVAASAAATWTISTSPAPVTPRSRMVGRARRMRARCSAAVPAFGACRPIGSRDNTDVWRV